MDPLRFSWFLEWGDGEGETRPSMEKNARKYFRVVIFDSKSANEVEKRFISDKDSIEVFGHILSIFFL